MPRSMLRLPVCLLLALGFVSCDSATSPSDIDDAPPTDITPELPYVIVDTGVRDCYSDSGRTACPTVVEPFWGQDAQVDGPSQAYTDNGDGTVTDLNTGLMWQKTPYMENQVTFAQATAGAGALTLGGHSDWRLPTVKELYSLMDFRGDSEARIAYMNETVFDFSWGDVAGGDRLIDAQYWTSTEYAGRVMNNQEAVFGVNFADGRIKGYPKTSGRNGQTARHFVRYVRANPAYGQNQFQLLAGTSTVLDLATGLEWQGLDSDHPMDWEGALSYCQGLVHDGHTDWRLPNIKELHSLVDYTRAPDAVNTSQRGPAINPVFAMTNPDGWTWSSTTHMEGPGPSAAAYIAFGRATGIMAGQLLNVHGAGAQRSDPKSGDPAQWAGGHGPQGDVIRIQNWVRCVRSAG